MNVGSNLKLHYCFRLHAIIFSLYSVLLLSTLVNGYRVRTIESGSLNNYTN